MVLTLSNGKGGITHIACVCGGNDFNIRDPLNLQPNISAESVIVCRNCGDPLPPGLTAKILEHYNVPAEKIIIP